MDWLKEAFIYSSLNLSIAVLVSSIHFFHKKIPKTTMIHGWISFIVIFSFVSYSSWDRDKRHKQFKLEMEELKRNFKKVE